MSLTHMRYLLVKLTMMFLCSGAANACTLESAFVPAKAHDVDFGTISISRSLPVGTTLATKDVATYGEKVVASGLCSPTYWRNEIRRGALVSGVVYSTGLEGVGFTIIHTNGSPFPQSYAWGGDPGAGFWYFAAGTYRISLIKTGNIVGGSLPTGVYGATRIDPAGDAVTIGVSGGVVSVCGLVRRN